MHRKCYLQYRNLNEDGKCIDDLIWSADNLIELW